MHVKTYGGLRKKINLSHIDGKFLKNLSCGSFWHLFDDFPDSWENMDEKKKIWYVSEHRKNIES